MRVALFFDGKNFYENLERARGGRHHLDYHQLAGWLVERVGGTRMTGAHYYTGTPDQLDPTMPEYRQLRGLVRFLDSLEYVEGFFVYRFRRIRRTNRCAACGVQSTYTEEKEVDTSMVADIIRLAASDAYDVMVLASGDADHAPAVEAVRTMGKVVYLASWGDEAMSPRLRSAAFAHIDLLNECPPEILGDKPDRAEDGKGDLLVTEERVAVEVDAELAERVYLEVDRAQRYFEDHGGYLGRGYFIHRWRGRDIPSDVELREAVLDHLVEGERIEELQILGETALRARAVEEDAAPPPGGGARTEEMAPPAAILGEERRRGDRRSTVEMPRVRDASARQVPAWMKATLEQHVDGDKELRCAWDSLRRAEEHFRYRGYVGRGYFLTKWRDVTLSQEVAVRERLLTRLIELGLVEQYTVDGTTALRSASAENDDDKPSKKKATS